MGVLAPGSAHAGPSAQPPIGTSGIFPVHGSVESPSNISPNPSEVIYKVSEVYDKSFRIYQLAWPSPACNLNATKSHHRQELSFPI